MFLAMYATWIAFGLILAMLGVMYTGWRIGKKLRGGPTRPANVGAIEGAVFALLGLLIAFTFSNGISRFEDRRQLIVEEANYIGTAYLRIDLLPQEAQPEMRNLFRSYLDSRLEVYRHIPDLKAAKTELDLGAQIQQRIWRHAIDQCKDQPAPCMMLLLPALNSMIDITTSRTAMSQFHPPMIVFILLIIFSLVAALLAGYGMAGATPSWLHIIAFSLAMAMTVYVILDVEYPRIGFIRIEHADQVLIDLRNSMN
ncbi:MAG TPA: hypothetical protein PLR20_03735 [Syntrophales bacterium]|nr:hypothetical protein [Syntrophales bacterium]HQM28445.1 hypothetical protein [Syntrophales bacterium]